MVGPYSLRVLPGAPVATPLEWQEVKDKSLKPDRYSLANIFRRLAHKKNPWKEMGRRAKDAAGPEKKLQQPLAEEKGIH